MERLRHQRRRARLTPRPIAVLLGVLAMLAATYAPRAAAQDTTRDSAAARLPETLPEALAGTQWRLVEFRSPDDGIAAQRPEDASRYTMSLGADGRVTMQLDCNQASGTWTATLAGRSFGFGPLRMTRTVCRQPSLDAQIARHTEFVSSFRLRDGLLYLNLTADGGTYVWEPLRE